jgi:hypothetical protein
LLLTTCLEQRQVDNYAQFTGEIDAAGGQPLLHPLCWPQIQAKECKYDNLVGIKIIK